jgi:hypothetical protein
MKEYTHCGTEREHRLTEQQRVVSESVNGRR